MTNSKLGEGEITQGLSSFSETLSCILRISNKVFGHLVLQRISLTLHKRLETAVCFQRPSATAGCSPPRTASDCRLLLSQDRQRLQAAREEETLWGVAYPPTSSCGRRRTRGYLLRFRWTRRGELAPPFGGSAGGRQGLSRGALTAAAAPTRRLRYKSLFEFAASRRKGNE